MYISAIYNILRWPVHNMYIAHVNSRNIYIAHGQYAMHGHCASEVPQYVYMLGAICIFPQYNIYMQCIKYNIARAIYIILARAILYFIHCIYILYCGNIQIAPINISKRPRQARRSLKDSHMAEGPIDPAKEFPRNSLFLGILMGTKYCVRQI